MDSYLWESGYDAQDVIDKLISFTGKPKILDRMFSEYTVLRCRPSGTERYSISLWNNYGISGRYAYTPASIRGEIIPTGKGCHVEAHFSRANEVVDVIAITAVTAVFYLAGIAALFTASKGSVAVSVTFGIVATAILTRYIYTRNKRKNKTECTLLEIIDRATAAERRKTQ